MKIEVVKRHDTIFISNTLYSGVKYIGRDRFPDIGVEYDYLEFSDTDVYAKNYYRINDSIIDLSAEMQVILISVCDNWVQPLGQEGNPTLEQAKENTLLKLNAKLDSDLKALTSNVAIWEATSWYKQEQQARSYIADNSAITPLLDGLVTHRGFGESKLQLAIKIIHAADAYEASYAAILGKHQAMLKRLEFATTVTDASAII